MQLAMQSRQQVEITGARSETTRLYANPNGTVSVDAGTGPRWVARTATVNGQAATSWVWLLTPRW